MLRDLILHCLSCLLSMIFLEAAAFPSPAFLFCCPRGMMNFNCRLLSKICQNLCQNDLFSSVVTSGMPLNQLYTPAKPKPACAERRYPKARVTAKPTLATAKPTLEQRRLQRCTTKPTPVFSIFFFPILCAVTSAVEIQAPPPSLPFKERSGKVRGGGGGGGCDRAFTEGGKVTIGQRLCVRKMRK